VNDRQSVITRLRDAGQARRLRSGLHQYPAVARDPPATSRDIAIDLHIVSGAIQPDARKRPDNVQTVSIPREVMTQTHSLIGD